MKASDLDVQTPRLARGVGRPEQVAAAAHGSHTGRFLVGIMKPTAPRKPRGSRAKAPAA